MKKLITIITIVTLVFGLAACEGESPEPEEPQEIVTLTVPADVVPRIGAWKIYPGEDLEETIASEKFIDAKWEPNGDLTISIDEKVRQEQLASHEEFGRSRFEALLNSEEKYSYVDFLYSYEVSDDFTLLTYVVNGDSFKRRANVLELITLQVSATYSVSYYQLYDTTKKKFGATITAVDYDTGETIDMINWPKSEWFQTFI